MAETTKPTNPKDAIGTDKLPLHLWPSTATAMGCVGLLNGFLKYGNLNWRAAGVRTSIYIDALLRHTYRFLEGEEVDPDDGVPHLAAMLACIAIIVDARAHGMLNDDRSYRGEGLPKLIEELTPHVARLKKLHEGRDPKHWTIADNAEEELCDNFLNLTGVVDENDVYIDMQVCGLKRGHLDECLFKAPKRFRRV